MRPISYSDGRTIPSVVQVWDDQNNPRAGFYRAYWCAGPDANAGSPVVGYCSPGGSFRTIRECVADVRRRYPGEACYRNGREVYPVKGMAHA